MLSSYQACIGINGRLKISTIDAVTGIVTHVDEGPNMVLNTGLEDICHLMAGDTTVPSDLLAGQTLYQTVHALPHVPLYGQFGSSGIIPASNNASLFDNGTLDQNASSPGAGVSDIVRATAFYPLSKDTPPISNSITVQFTLSPNQGNGIGGTDTVYREAVLMSKIQDNPIKYSWFARRVFGDIIKNPTTIIKAEWTFIFIIDRNPIIP
jgi:hypothetical protein